MERFRISVDAEARRRNEGMIDQRFALGKQWDEDIQRKRDSQGRPCLTINRIPGFLSHVLNNMRQSRPEIKVDPVGDGADEEIAEIRQGLIRHIAIQSRADIAYDKSFEGMCTSGLGYLRVVDGWAADSDMKMDRDKDLFIQWVSNPFTVYEDPTAAKPDWSDGRYKFIVEDVSPEEFRRRYGKDRQASSLNNFQSIGDHQSYWLPGGQIRIAEYWHIDERDDRLCELEDGTTAYESELEAWARIVRSEPRKVPVVTWTLMTALEILQERTWPGKFIPVVPVIGNQVDLDGERMLAGMVRYAREPQRMYNYMYSSFVEIVGLAPKAPYVLDMQSIEGFQNIWDRSNTELFAYLPYNSRDLGNGSPIPPPQRQQSEPPIAALVQGLKLADENLKATFSIYDASLGQRGPQESGLAINSRKVESDLATYQWIDSFTRALQFLGIVLDDLLQYYYNSPGRIIQILREDDSKRPVTLNQQHMVDGEEKIYDLSKGKFAVVVTTGPSVPTRRRESAQSMMELVKVYPQLMQFAGPQIIKAMDWPGKDAIASQLEKTMPPALQTKDDKDPNALPPEAQQKISQLEQVAQQLTQALHAATDETAQQRQKEEWATYRTQIQSDTQLALGGMKSASDHSAQIVDQIFEEMKLLRQVLEPQLFGPQGPQGGQGSPPSAPPAAPPSPTAQSPAGGPPAG